MQMSFSTEKKEKILVFSMNNENILKKDNKFSFYEKLSEQFL